MDILGNIIETMDKEEMRHYRLFSSRFQSGENRKDWMLLDAIRKNPEAYDEEKIFRKLYQRSFKSNI